MANATKQNATSRMVILLRPSEKQRIQRLARKEHVSSAEIVRRSLAAYTEPSLAIDDKEIATMNDALDHMLAKIHSTREHVQKNLAEIRAMREGRK